MKIIKQGILPEEEEFTHICPHCRTIYEFAKNECKFSSSPKNESYYIIDCPFCKQKNYINYYDMRKLKKRESGCL